MAELPEKIGPYKILRMIGEGGMGIVYEGVHELIERQVAIKVLHPEYAQRAEFVARFFNEARAVNRIAHPGLVQISDFGQLPDKSAYIVMEFLSGDSLARRIKSSGGPLSVDQALNFGYQLADALAAAHEKDIIHRDLKPDNVMIVPDAQAPGGERTKLLDFGIAKLEADSGQIQVKTNTNALMGTPYYMSPEQCRGAGKVDGRTDVYALGVMLYEVLCGERPLTGEGQGDIIVKHMTQEPQPLRSRVPEIPEAVAALVHRMLIKDREKRPVMQEVALELEALSAQAPPPNKRRTTSNIPIVSSTGPAHRSGPVGGTAAGGTAAGQANAAKPRGRSIGLAMLAVATLTVTGVVGIKSWRQRVAAATRGPATSPAVRSIRLSVDSAPVGAEVIQVGDGQVLGKTPWTAERPAAPGTLKLRLRLTGYADKDVELGQDTDGSRKETLLALAEAKPPPEPGSDVTEPRRGVAGKRGKSADKGVPGLAKKPKRKGGPKSGHVKSERHIED